MNTPPIKTCDYCSTKGVMPTFMDGETVCGGCSSSLPKTVPSCRKEIVRLRSILDRIVIGEPGDVHIYIGQNALDAGAEYLEGK